MPLTKNDKEQLVSDYANGLAEAPHAFLLSYQGITVPQVTTLRDRVRQSGGYYEVVKNTLALRAIDGKPLGDLKEHFVGPTAVVYSAKKFATFVVDVQYASVAWELVSLK